MLVYCSEHTQSLEVGRLAIAYPSSKLSCTHCSVTTFFLSFHAAGHRDHLASSFFFERERRTWDSESAVAGEEERVGVGAPLPSLMMCRGMT